MWNPVAPSLKGIKIEDLLKKMNELADMLRKPASPSLRNQILQMYQLYQLEYRERLAEQVQKDKEAWLKKKGKNESA